MLSSVTEGASSAATGGVVAAQVLSGGTGSLVVTVMNILELALLLRYCSVGYPDNVETFFNALSGNADLLPNPMSLVIKDDLYSQSHWHRFEKFEESVNFLDNCGGAFFKIVGCVLLVGLLKLLQKCSGKFKTYKKVLQGILAIFEWNNTLSFLLGAQVDMALAWAIQFSEPAFETTYGLMNFIIALFSFFLVLIIYMHIAKLNTWNANMIKKQARMSRRRVKTVDAQRAKSLVLWNDYNASNSIGKNFLLFTLLKNTLVVAVVYFLPQIPLLQGLTLFMISVMFLMVVAIGKPLKAKDQMVCALVNETAWVLQSTLLLYFSILKTLEKDSNHGRTAGWVFIVTIIGELAFNLLFILYSVVSQIAAWCKRRNVRSHTSNSRENRPSHRASVAKSSKKSHITRRKKHPVLTRHHEAAQIKDHHVSNFELEVNNSNNNISANHSSVPPQHHNHDRLPRRRPRSHPQSPSRLVKMQVYK